MDVRDEKQDEIALKYSVEKPVHSTLVLSTGFGKSFTFLKILKQYAPKIKKVLLVVNSVDLRDRTWRVEFTKIGLGEFYEENVTSLTYAYLYNKKYEDLNLDPDTFVVFDEADHIAETDQLARCFTLLKAHTILGLTGFITDLKKEWFNENMPIFFEYLIDEAQADELLNKFHFIFVRYEISSAKDIKVSYKKGGVEKSFMTSENANYEYRQKEFIKAIIAKDRLEDDYNNGSYTYATYAELAVKAGKKIMFAANNRKSVLNCLNSSVKVVNNILKKLSDRDKILIFSNLTDQAAKLSPYTYSTKNSKELNKINFDRFNTSEVSSLAVCSKINRGVNIKALNVAILESFYGSDTQATQRFGRMSRLDKDDTARVYVLLPYYRKKDKDGNYKLAETQQVAWARNMLRSTVITSHEFIDLRKI